MITKVLTERMTKAGNVWEWNETSIGENRGNRGGSWDCYASDMPSFYRNNGCEPTYEALNVGFRVAKSEEIAVPEPLSAGLMLVSVGGLVLRRIRKS